MKILIQIPRQMLRNKVRWCIGGLLLLLCILIGVGWIFTDHQPSHIDEKIR